MKSPPSAYWHTLPLHYLPHLFATGVLYSQDELRTRGLPVRPRPKAAQRDRKLRLARFVHLSFVPSTPLLADKRARGYPHALIAFAADLASEETAAFCPYNARAWRHREDFLPIREQAAKAAFLEAWCGGRYPSAELLIENALPLVPHGLALHLASDSEADWVQRIAKTLVLPLPFPLHVSPTLFPPGVLTDMKPLEEYAAACQTAGKLLPPPNLPFD